MARTFWIIGLGFACFMLSVFALVCVIALITHKHLNLTGWTTLVIGSYGAYFMFGRMRAAIRYGDPTKDMGLSDSNE
jgi:hypothetical protein